MDAQRERWVDLGAERAVLVSPLLNLAPASERGAAMRQHLALVPLAGSAIRGSALLALTPDRRTLDVELRLERPRGVSIDLRRVVDGDEELLIVEIAAGGPSGHALCRGRRFALDRPAGFAAFRDPQELHAAELHLSSGQADAVEGIAVAPARRGDGSYFAERMLSEIAAAESSGSAAAASRHVELATLYARHLSSGGAEAR